MSAEQDGPQMFMAESNCVDLIARTADFLHRHSADGYEKPWNLPSEVQLYYLHMAEHLLRYQGVLPSPEQLPWLTRHTGIMSVDNPHRIPKLTQCDGGYFGYMAADESAGYDLYTATEALANLIDALKKEEGNNGE